MNKVYEKPEFIKSDIKLTIGILVSNQIKYIRKCMEAVSPLLKAIPSEMIVVDTVGEEKSDGSLAIAKEYTDKVYHFDWIDDFSAARNVAFEYARGEWFMFFDDDEIFDDVKELIDFFKSGECEKYNYAQYYVMNYTDGDHYQKDVVGRLIRRTRNTRFVGIIHECFNEAFPPVKQFNTFVHHYGYLFTTKEQLEEKNRRNLRLLEKAYEKDGPSVRLCVQIVQQLMVPDPEKAYKRCCEFLDIYEGDDELQTPLGQWLITAKLRISVILGDYEKILSCEGELLKKYRLSETARLVIAHRATYASFCAAKYDTASERVKEYFKLYDWLMENENRRFEQVIIDFSSFMTGERLFAIAQMGVISENARGCFEEAYGYIGRLDYDYCRDFNAIKQVIDVTLRNLKEPEYAIAFYRQFYRDELFEHHELQKCLPAIVREKIKNDE